MHKTTVRVTILIFLLKAVCANLSPQVAADLINMFETSCIGFYEPMMLGVWKLCSNIFDQDGNDRANWQDILPESNVVFLLPTVTWCTPLEYENVYNVLTEYYTKLGLGSGNIFGDTHALFRASDLNADGEIEGLEAVRVVSLGGDRAVRALQVALFGYVMDVNRDGRVDNAELSSTLEHISYALNRSILKAVLG